MAAKQSLFNPSSAFPLFFSPLHPGSLFCLSIRKMKGHKEEEEKERRRRGRSRRRRRIHHGLVFSICKSCSYIFIYIFVLFLLGSGSKCSIHLEAIGVYTTNQVHSNRCAPRPNCPPLLLPLTYIQSASRAFFYHSRRRLLVLILTTENRFLYITNPLPSVLNHFLVRKKQSAFFFVL